MKDNPKHITAQKAGKTPFEQIPLKALEGAAKVLEHGSKKYGFRNWRKDKIKTSTYQGAMLRHLSSYFDGEDLDPDSGENHLSHVLACCVVMLDAEQAGSLIDDREACESFDPHLEPVAAFDPLKAAEDFLRQPEEKAKRYKVTGVEKDDEAEGYPVGQVIERDGGLCEESTGRFFMPTQIELGEPEEKKDFKPGDSVKVVSLEATKDAFGLEKEMEGYVGEVRTVLSASSFGLGWELEGEADGIPWRFHKDDLELVE